MSSLCWECKYEHSDCKGNKWIEKTKCDYFSKKCAINYPERIRELERQLKFETELWGNLAQMNDEQAEEIDRLKAENEELKAEIEKYKNLVTSFASLDEEWEDCFEDCSAYAKVLQDAKDTCKECLTVNDCVKEECRWHWIIKALEIADRFEVERNELKSENEELKAQNREIHDVSNTHVHKSYKLIKKTMSRECDMWSDTEKISYIEGVMDFAEELGGNAE